MSEVFSGFKSFVWAVVKIPLYGIALFCVCLGVSVIIYALADFISGKRLKHSKEVVYVKPKKVSLFRKLFLDFPRQFITICQVCDHLAFWIFTLHGSHILNK